MPIWQLTPRDPTVPEWAASNYVGRAVIRAATERDARQAAVQAFGKAHAGVPWHAHPWRQLALVRCEELPASGYPATGRTAILEPAAFTCW
jgi:hypothetical protein